MSIPLSSNSYSFYYDKKTNNLIGGLSAYYSDRGLENLFSFYSPKASHNDYFISVMPSSYLAEYVMAAKSHLLEDKPFQDNFKKLSIDDNPVLFFYKLKAL